MATPYNSNYIECFPFSDSGVMMTLAANTALPWTVPGTADMVYRANFSISTSSDAWVNINGTAVGPSSNTATTTYNQERIGVNFIRYVKGGDVLSFISSGTPQIGVSLLQLPS